MQIEFKEAGKDGVALDTADGLYLTIKGPHAQVIVVGNSACWSPEEIRKALCEKTGIVWRIRSGREMKPAELGEYDDDRFEWPIATWREKQKRGYYDLRLTTAPRLEPEPEAKP